MVKFEPMRAIILILFAQVLGSISAVSAGDRFAEEARPRVEHHLLEAEQLVQHFESVLSQECPRFGTAGERRAGAGAGGGASGVPRPPPPPGRGGGQEAAREESPRGGEGAARPAQERA